MPSEYEQAIREQESEINKFLNSLDQLHVAVASYYEYIGKQNDKQNLRKFEHILSKIDELNGFDESYGRTNQLLYALFNTNSKRYNMYLDLQKKSKKT